MLPFLATFAVGVFIASFFVAVSGPTFRKPFFGKRNQEMRRLRIENEQLRNENLRLKNQVENQNWSMSEMPAPPVPMEVPYSCKHKNLGPEWPVEAPPPPPVPRAHR